MRPFILLLTGLALFLTGAWICPEPADARGGFGRSRSHGHSRMKISRMKTYRFNGKDISGYRALVRERRAAKLASGGYTMRKDGSVIHRHFRPRVGRLGFSGRPLKPAPIAAMADVQGQCRDGTIITTSMVDWGCRHAGGTGWSHKPARITGLRED